jgi:hypothetical protein
MRIACWILSPLTPNDPYRGRTAPLTFKRCILYIYSTNIGTEYFKHGIYSPFFFLQDAVCFIILTYLVPVLFAFYVQGMLKLKKNNSGAKSLRSHPHSQYVILIAFPLQQWLHERASALHYKYVACLFLTCNSLRRFILSIYPYLSQSYTVWISSLYGPAREKCSLATEVNLAVCK